jgi:hypothetical protein
MKRTVIATMLLLGAVVIAHADAWTFKDVSRPHGSERDIAAKRADARRCGSSDGLSFYTVDASRFKKCMRGRGWALDHIEQETAHAPDNSTIVHFDDVRKPGGQARGDVELQVDTRRCEVGTPDLESPGFQHCMRSLSWRYSYTRRSASPSVDWTDFLPCCGQ